MALLRQAPRWHRRAILIYLLAIVVPTLVLLYLGLESVRRQREAIAGLTISNLRLSGERLAAELERRTEGLAEAALRDPQLSRLPSVADAPFTPEAARGMRGVLDRVRERHPIARHFFVFQGNDLRFPLLRTPPARPLHVPHMEKGSRFAALFAEAENQELRLERPDLALVGYRQSYELEVSGSWKAQALARVARCLQKTHQPNVVEQAYRTLLERYGDQYDSFYRPYALVAGLELASPQLLAGLYRDLLRGRWELSAEQFDYFRERFEERLKTRGETQETPYVSHLKLARALEEGFRHHGPLRAGVIYSFAFTRGETGYQTHYALLPAGGQETLLGLAVDLGWVKAHLLPQCMTALGMNQDVQVAVTDKEGPAASALGPGARVPFRSLYPFWELSLAPASGRAGQGLAPRATLIFAGSTVLVLSVLVLGVLLLLRDVSRDMELNRMRGDFVSAVSHELKTPLTLIRLYGETLLHGEDFPEQERKGYYQIITRESERLTLLIEKVLDFSRIERGKKQYQFEKGDLAPVVAGTVEVYEQYLKRRGFSVEADLARALPPVEFDPEAVSQAVLNLLDNAAKFSGESKYVGVRLRSENDRVVFEVEDHGIGLRPEDREKIFQQFYRAPDGAGKGGYGLGLFLVKHIMEAHGGSIELESESGRGSRFRLIFPCTRS